MINSAKDRLRPSKQSRVLRTLIIAFALFIVPLAIHSQSGRQKPPGTPESSNTNTRARQVSKPTNQQSNTQSSKAEKKKRTLTIRPMFCV